MNLDALTESSPGELEDSDRWVVDAGRFLPSALDRDVHFVRHLSHELVETERRDEADDSFRDALATVTRSGLPSGGRSRSRCIAVAVLGQAPVNSEDALMFDGSALHGTTANPRARGDVAGIGAL